MIKNKYLILCLLFAYQFAYSQRVSIGGNVQDTSAKTSLKNCVVIAIKLNDSTLTAYTRTNDNGFFKLQNLPIDTYQVVISHPLFSDQSYYILGSDKNYEFDFGRIVLPDKNVTLNEVVIYAFKDPVYYKGDTLIYTADSFKTKPNATVEDLLKKLPGISVDEQGKIKTQGKAVDKVLVDGDEFFGADPTIATKNLNATAIESVQIYEQKNENATSTDNTEDMLKILNLTLKEDAKKGYFGKVSGGTDFQKFYEGEFLANRFSKKQKISVFNLTSNTPRSSIGWDDAGKYGLSDEGGSFSEDGTSTYIGNNEGTGIPQTMKTGIYYSDKLSEKTKVNANYSYKTSLLETKSETVSQYFLADTSYTTDDIKQSFTNNHIHSVNLSINHTLDSLTELQLEPKFNYSQEKQTGSTFSDFIASDNTLTRESDISNTKLNTSYGFSSRLGIKRRFKKENRKLSFNYNLQINNNESNGILKNDNLFYSTPLILVNNINQKKTIEANKQVHNVSINYTEPLTKKIKLEFSYGLNFDYDTKNKKALNNINGEYSSLDSTFTNSFTTKRINNRLGSKFIYEVKKHRFSVGASVRNITIENKNAFTQQSLNQSVNNILHSLSYRYKFSDNESILFNYYTSSDLPSIIQLQPVPDNTNPNFINIGNPNLRPSYVNHFEASYYSYKFLSGINSWIGFGGTHTLNDFANSTVYDSIGRNISKTINVNGNINAYMYSGITIPILSKKIEFSPKANGAYSQTKNYINNKENISQTINGDVGLEVKLNLEKITAAISGNYAHTSPKSTISTFNNTPYSSQNYTASFSYKLPYKITVNTDADYKINNQRTNGYNINYLVWNASLGKTFLMRENLIISFEAYDMLNQNINVYRSTYDNVITDEKTNIISRYFLLKGVFKFNSNKTKEENDEFTF